MNNATKSLSPRMSAAPLRRDLAVFCFFLSFWLLVFGFSGSLFSGYHLADDHEILRMSRDLAAGGGVFAQAQKWIEIDFHAAHRFKPFYYLHRVAEAGMFGCDFFLWLVYTGILAALTSFFLYLFVKKQGFALLESLLFPLFALIGKQGVVWWSLGPAEAIGMTMLAASLFCMLQTVLATSKRWLWLPLFVLFAVLMSLSKESFIVVLPALMFWNIWLDHDKRSVRWDESFKRNAGPLLVLGFVFVSEVLFIFRYVGTGGYSSLAGGLDGFAPFSYLKTAITTLLSISSVGYGLIFMLGLLLLFFFSRKEEGVLTPGVRFAKDFRWPFVLFLLLVGPQCILYARSGFYGRYLLPLLFGYAVLLTYFLNYLNIHRDRYRLSLPRRGGPISMILSGAALGAGILFLCVGVVLLWRSDLCRNIFAMLGKPTQASADFVKPAVLAILAGVWLSVFFGMLRKKNQKAISLYFLILCLSLSSLTLKTVNFIQLKEFVREGRQLALLRTLVREHTRPDDVLMVARDPVYPENGYSVKIMLDILGDRKRVFLFGDTSVFRASGDHDLNRWYDSHFKGSNFFDLADKKAVRFVIVMGGPTRLEQERDFLARIQPYLDMSMFQRQDIDPFVVYFEP